MNERAGPRCVKAGPSRTSITLKRHLGLPPPSLIFERLPYSAPSRTGFDVPRHRQVRHQTLQRHGRLVYSARTVALREVPIVSSLCSCAKRRCRVKGCNTASRGGPTQCQLQSAYIDHLSLSKGDAAGLECTPQRARCRQKTYFCEQV